MSTAWDNRSLQNMPGQWRPTAEPFRVTATIKTGPRYHDFRSVVRTFANEADARAFGATVPAKHRARLSVAVNAATWRQNGHWTALGNV